MELFFFAYFSFLINVAADNWYEIDEDIPEDTWFQAVMIYNGPNGGIRVHVNDKIKHGEVREGKRYRGESSGHVVIGRRFVTSDKKYCSAMVDELMLWNRSLTIQEAEHLISIY